jgi:hypothetical protein
MFGNFAVEHKLTFIRLADLIVNLNCIATVKFSTYTAFDGNRDIPTVNICLRLPEGSLDDGAIDADSRFRGVEKLEFEGELALEIWNYFIHSKAVTVLFE